METIKRNELQSSVRVDEIRQKLRHRADRLNVAWAVHDAVLAADCVRVMLDAESLLVQVQEQQQAHDAHVTAACQLATGVIAAELREARAQIEEQQQEIARLGDELEASDAVLKLTQSEFGRHMKEWNDIRGQLTVLQSSAKELIGKWETRPTTFESSEARQAREECAAQLSTLIDQTE